MGKLATVFLSSGLSLIMATSLHAAEGAERGAINDYVTLRLGGMYAESDSTLRGSAPQYGLYDTRSVSYNDFDKKWIPRAEGLLRLANRHRLIFNYFKYDQDARATLNDDVIITNVEIPAGSFVQGGIELQIASLVYDFEVIQTERFGLGLQLGAHWAKAEASAEAQVGQLYQGQLFKESVDGFAPVIGARLTFEPIDRLLINLQGQYLDANWGNFDDYDGEIKRANAVVEYRFAKNFGGFIGYDWFNLELDQNFSSGFVGIEQEFKGPIAGITLAF